MNYAQLDSDEKPWPSSETCKHPHRLSKGERAVGPARWATPSLSVICSG
jgi:hypothetical protein